MTDYFKEGHIPATDDPAEQIRIGQDLEALRPDVYNEREKTILNRIYQQILPDVSADERAKTHYHCVYDYWMYGANIKEVLNFRFPEKTHEEKQTYITMRNRYLFYQHMNDVKWAYRNLGHKYACYQLLREDFKRDAILIEKEDDYPEFENFVKKHSTFVVKPTTQSFGRGIHLAHADPKTDDLKAVFHDILSERDELVKKYLVKESSEQYILEEVIAQGEGVAALHPSSVNCVRLQTLAVDGKVYFPYPRIKVGRKGNFISNLGDDGMIVGIGPDGVCNTDGCDEQCRRFACHPDTGIRFKGYVMPEWDQLLDLGRKLALQLAPKVGMIGWDMAYTTKGWAVLEANHAGEFIGSEILYQKGFKKELEDMMHWKPEKEYWWQEKIQYGPEL